MIRPSVPWPAFDAAVNVGLPFQLGIFHASSSILYLFSVSLLAVDWVILFPRNLSQSQTNTSSSTSTLSDSQAQPFLSPRNFARWCDLFHSGTVILKKLLPVLVVIIKILRVGLRPVSIDSLQLCRRRHRLESNTRTLGYWHWLSTMMLHQQTGLRQSLRESSPVSAHGLSKFRPSWTERI